MTRRNAFRGLLISLAVLTCGLSPASAQVEVTESVVQKVLREATEPIVQKVIRLEHISARQASAVISPLLAGVDFSPVPELKLLSVRGPEGKIQEIERVLREVDVPQSAAESDQPLNVVFTGYLVGASDSQESSVPEQVRDAVTEMRKHFPYKNYTLLETFGIRTLVGAKAVVSGLTSTAPDQPAMPYEIVIEMGEVSETATRRIIRIRGLRSTWRLPSKAEPEDHDFEEPELSTSLDIPEGATVVVGKAGAVGAYQGIFLLLKAEVVEP